MSFRNRMKNWFTRITTNSPDVSKVLALMWFFSLIGIVMMLIPSIARLLSENWSSALISLGTCLFLGGASIVLGTMLGFLFGVPKSNTNNDKPVNNQYIPNTNLELISDWLTKIIVGIGLVQFPQIMEQFDHLGKFAGPAIGNTPMGEILAICIVIHYLIIGFIQGFLLAYLWLPNAFRRANQSENNNVKNNNENS